jgi:hypothetical protein
MSDEKALAIQQMTVNDLITLANACSRSQVETAKIMRKMLYAHDNGLPLSLAVTGGLFIASEKTGAVGIESKPLKNRIANDPNYHIEVTKSDSTICEGDIYRRASYLWPYKIYGDSIQDGDWVKIGSTSFTIDDAKRIKMHDGGGFKPLADRDTYKNTPQQMLHYRWVQKIVSLYGDGIFGNPPQLPGEMNDDAIVIEGELVRTPTLQEIIEEYGHDAVLKAINETGDNPAKIVQWLQENEDETVISQD